MSPIEFRIFLDSGEAVDWSLPSGLDISFVDFLEVLARVEAADASRTAFRYEDPEGDLVTVRGEEEFRLMLSGCVLERDCTGADISEQAAVTVKVWPGEGGLGPSPVLAPGLFSRHPVLLGPDTRPHLPHLPHHQLTSSTSPPSQPLRDSRSSNSHNMVSGGDSEMAAVFESRPVESEGGSLVARSQDDSSLLSEADLDLGGLIGTGSSGEVYRAVERRTGAEVAVKVTQLDVATSDQQQILAELAILTRCRCPHIVAFRGAFFRDDRIYSCTELMDGGSLDAFCSSRVPEHVLRHLMSGVITGLDYLWSMKIMHRDVKPSNILVNRAGDVKLCDFGVSIQLVQSIAKTYIGTNAYMAPERIQGEQYGMYSDIWSVGVTLCELAQGRFPFNLANVGKDGRATPHVKLIDLIHAIVLGEPPSLPDGEFSPEISDFVSRCLQKTPSDRPKPSTLLRHPFLGAVDPASSNNVIATWLANTPTRPL